jgi:hypothetical protein
MRGSAGISRRRHSTGSVFSTMQVGALLKSVQRLHQVSKLPPYAGRSETRSPQLVAGWFSVQSRGGGTEIAKVQSEPSKFYSLVRRDGRVHLRLQRAANRRIRREMAVVRVL